MTKNRRPLGPSFFKLPDSVGETALGTLQATNAPVHEVPPSDEVDSDDRSEHRSWEQSPRMPGELTILNLDATNRRPL